MKKISILFMILFISCKPLNGISEDDINISNFKNDFIKGYEEVTMIKWFNLADSIKWYGRYGLKCKGILKECDLLDGKL